MLELHSKMLGKEESRASITHHKNIAFQRQLNSFLKCCKTSNKTINDDLKRNE